MNDLDAHRNEDEAKMAGAVSEAALAESQLFNKSPNEEGVVQRYSVTRVRTGLILTSLGFLVFSLGIRPGLFSLDRSPVIGFVQIATFLVGLGIMCMGGYLSLVGLWGSRPLTLLADIGSRLVATGFVICVFSGMADVFGFGSHLLPDKIPYFGQFQALGVQIGQFIITLGFIVLIPFHRLRKDTKDI